MNIYISFPIPTAQFSLSALPFFVKLSFSKPATASSRPFCIPCNNKKNAFYCSIPSSMPLLFYFLCFQKVNSICNIKQTIKLCLLLKCIKHTTVSESGMFWIRVCEWGSHDQFPSPGASCFICTTLLGLTCPVVVYQQMVCQCCEHVLQWWLLQWSKGCVRVLYNGMGSL